MLFEEPLTDRDIAFLALHPEPVVVAEMLQAMFPSSEAPIQVFSGGQFYYQPDNDEYLYCLTIPHVKVVFRSEGNYDKAWSILREAAAKLAAAGVREPELVLIDKEGLKNNCE